MSVFAAGQPEHSQAVPGAAQPRVECRSPLVPHHPSAGLPGQKAGEGWQG